MATTLNKILDVPGMGLLFPHQSHFGRPGHHVKEIEDAAIFLLTLPSLPHMVMVALLCKLFHVVYSSHISNK